MTPAASQGFITVTVGGPNSPLRSPGDFDPVIPFRMAAILTSEARDLPTNSIAPGLLRANGRQWYNTGMAMGRPSQLPWWRYPVMTVPDEMTYECDASLGNPTAADCTHIEWNQLGPPSDSLTVQPGNTKFLYSGTCYLAISASLTTVLTWDQVQTAVATLMNICIQLPFQAARGGRAYFGPQPQQISGKRKKKRLTAVTGLNALPPHVNLTVFQQTEPWTNPAQELNSCTWKAASNRKVVSSCQTA